MSNDLLEAPPSESPARRARPRLNKMVVKTEFEGVRAVNDDSSGTTCSFFGGCGWSDRCDCCSVCTSCVMPDTVSTIGCGC